MNFFEWILWILAWLSSDAAAIDQEAPRAAAAVSAAMASMAPDAPSPTPAPPGPAKCICGGTCRNGIYKPDGHLEHPCPCPKSCPCKAGKCPDGKCPKAGG